MNKPLTLDGNPPLRALLREAERLDCSVETRRRTGEVRVITPTGARLNLNRRRKDGARALIRELRRLQQKEPRP